MILVAYRHGLRASEVCDLQWQQIELAHGKRHAEIIIARAFQDSDFHPMRIEKVG